MTVIITIKIITILRIVFRIIREDTIIDVLFKSDFHSRLILLKDNKD